MADNLITNAEIHQATTELLASERARQAQMAASNQKAMEKLLRENGTSVGAVPREFFGTSESGPPSFIKTAMRLFPRPRPAPPKVSRLAAFFAKLVGQLRDRLERVEHWLVPESPTPEPSGLFIPPYVRRWRTGHDSPGHSDGRLILGLYDNKAVLVSNTFQHGWIKPETYDSFNPTQVGTPLLWIPLTELVDDDWYHTCHRPSPHYPQHHLKYLGTSDCKTFRYLCHDGTKFFDPATDDVVNGDYDYWTRLPGPMGCIVNPRTPASPQEVPHASL